MNFKVGQVVKVLNSRNWTRDARVISFDEETICVCEEYLDTNNEYQTKVVFYPISQVKE